MQFFSTREIKNPQPDPDVPCSECHVWIEFTIKAQVTLMGRTLKQRQKAIANKPAALAEALGVPRSSASAWLGGYRSPSITVIDQILDAHPDVSARWLIGLLAERYRDKHQG